MPTHTLTEELLIHGPVLLDGAWGTELQARGLASGGSGDFWNLDHPERVEEVARSHVDAGSQAVLTNTFRATRIALAKHPERHRLAKVNRAGVATCRRAAADRARVFGSIGPSGKLLLTREVDPESLRHAFAEQAETLAEGGADVIGANCGSGVAGYVRVCRRLATATSRPIWIKANAGIPRISSGKVVYPTASDRFAAHVDALVAAGARFIGGCCGTNPSPIRALAARLAGGRQPAGARER